MKSARHSDVVPRAFNFPTEWLPKEKGKDKAKDKAKSELKKLKKDFIQNADRAASADAEEPAKPGKLPSRVALEALSQCVGWRPSGLNSGQAQLYSNRFWTEFRLGAMCKVVCPQLGGLPYIAPDGHLPCCCLSTSNALKFNESMHKNGKTPAEHDAKALEEMTYVWQMGVQLEWIECKSYLEFMLYMEQIQQQSSVNVNAHITDTCVIYVQFLSSPESIQVVSRMLSGEGSAEKAMQVALGPDAGELDTIFTSYLRGKAVHRLKEAKQVLRSTHREALLDIVQFRKKNHYIYANACAQMYFLTPEWLG